MAHHARIRLARVGSAGIAIINGYALTGLGRDHNVGLRTQALGEERAGMRRGPRGQTHRRIRAEQRARERRVDGDRRIANVADEEFRRIASRCRHGRIPVQCRADEDANWTSRCRQAQRARDLSRQTVEAIVAG
jgi:hypothetical protein